MRKMSNIGVLNEDNDHYFKWGAIKGRGRNDRDMQFYDSFTYDGVQYRLYDCAIFYQEGDLETSIGKLVKLYETPNRERKVKVVWFVRPIEIRTFLGNIKPRWNEVFLACGEGQGLFNVNSVEAIIGKCNVVCTSKDERNPPASEAELNAADYVFYRAFDVRNRTVSEKFADRIEGIEVDRFFNRKNYHSIALNNVKSNVEEHIKCSNSPSKIGLDRKIHNGANDHKLIGLNNVKRARVEEREKYSNSPSKIRLGRVIYNGVNDHKHTAPNNVKANAEEQTKYSNSPSKIGLDRVIHNEVNDHKLTASNYIKATAEEQNKNSNSPSKTGVDKAVHNEVKDDKPRPSFRFVVKGLESNKHVASEGEQSDIQPYKKRKLVQNAEDPTTRNTAPPEVKGSDAMGRILDKAIPKVPRANGVKTESNFFAVTRRPDAERRAWFRQSPWVEKLDIARESGTLVLLENLDPSYTSFQIEDILWSALKERVEAKMMQRSTFSNPHSGKALVIFKSKEVADNALNRLRRTCLMLLDGRPIVAHRKSRAWPGKSESFAGHLTLEQTKYQKQREERANAVSTSHCSQPNTSEYDLAVEWRQLYEKSDLWWEALHKHQVKEIHNLKDHFKEALS